MKRLDAPKLSQEDGRRGFRSILCCPGSPVSVVEGGIEQRQSATTSSSFRAPGVVRPRTMATTRRTNLMPGNAVRSWAGQKRTASGLGSGLSGVWHGACTGWKLSYSYPRSP